MSVSLKIESANFANALRKLEKNVKGSTEEYILQQAGTFTREIIKHTYPKKKSDGTKAVTRDLKRAAEPVKATASGKMYGDWDSINDPRLRKQLQQLTRAKNYKGVEEIMKRFKGRKNVQVEPFRAYMHKGARDNRGRVKKRTNTVTLDYRQWNQYRKKKMANVGLVKHGWMGSVRRLRMYGVNVKVPPALASQPRPGPDPRCCLLCETRTPTCRDTIPL